MNKNFKKVTRYKKTIWLNDPESSSTGSIVCYDGSLQYEDTGDRMVPCRFVEIADCHQKVRLHQTHVDTLDEYKNKIDALILGLTAYRAHLDLINEDTDESSVENIQEFPVDFMKPYEEYTDAYIKFDADITKALREMGIKADSFVARDEDSSIVYTYGVIAISSLESTYFIGLDEPDDPITNADGSWGLNCSKIKYGKEVFLALAKKWMDAKKQYENE